MAFERESQCPMKSCCLPPFQSESWCTTIQMQMSVVFSCKSNSLSFEWLSTKTRFEPGANSNSEMAYCLKYIFRLRPCCEGYFYLLFPIPRGPLSHHLTNSEDICLEALFLFKRFGFDLKIRILETVSVLFSLRSGHLCCSVCSVLVSLAVTVLNGFLSYDLGIFG